MYARYLVAYNKGDGPSDDSVPEDLTAELQARLPADWVAWAENAAKRYFLFDPKSDSRMHAWPGYAAEHRLSDGSYLYAGVLLPVAAQPETEPLTTHVGPVNTRIVEAFLRRGAPVYLWRGRRIVELLKLDRVKGGSIAHGTAEPLLHPGAVQRTPSGWAGPSAHA